MLFNVKKFVSLCLFSGCSLASCPPVVETIPQSLTKGPELLIFVSFSMPEHSLQLWSEQAAKVQGKLLLRGFVEDSLPKTTAKALELLGDKQGAELLIDPEAFQQFNVQAVPAVVLTEKQNCQLEPCPPPHFDLVYGDTSLEAALQFISVKGSSQGQEWSQALLKRYRGMYE